MSINSSLKGKTLPLGQTPSLSRRSPSSKDSANEACSLRNHASVQETSAATCASSPICEFVCGLPSFMIWTTCYKIPNQAKPGKVLAGVLGKGAGKKGVPAGVLAKVPLRHFASESALASTFASSPASTPFCPKSASAPGHQDRKLSLTNS